MATEKETPKEDVVSPEQAAHPPVEVEDAHNTEEIHEQHEQIAEERASVDGVDRPSVDPERVTHPTSATVEGDEVIVDGRDTPKASSY